MASPNARRLWGGLAALALLFLMQPLSVSAHSELVSSAPAEGTTVPSPFTGPVVLTFSEHLADGSKADLIGADGTTVETATVDASAPTMTFSLTAPLAPGTYQVKWTSIADDGDLLRGILTFTVAAAAASVPEPSTSPEPSTAPTNPPGAASTAAAATPAASPAADSGTGGSDVILPIVIVLLGVVAGAFYLIRRRRPA
jgi:methionine-rich copper-binding protein CopC